MSTLRTIAFHGPRRSGFTLIEVLIAIAILLIGVVAALRIFPRGFDIFTETTQSQTAQKLLAQYIGDFSQDPDSVPDAIEPLDIDPANPYPYDCTTATIGEFFSDTRMVDYQSTATTWYSQHLYPSATGPSWPLWEARSVRTIRLVRGERVHIPTDYNRGTAFAPYYVPRFAPIIPNGTYNLATNTYILRTDNSGAVQPLTIYDLRYQSVTPEALTILKRNPLKLSGVSAITFTPAVAGNPGANDLSVAGYSGVNTHTYTIQITDSTYQHNKFKWKLDNRPWSADLDIAATAQVLQDVAFPSDLLTIVFASNDGHQVGDQWTMNVDYPTNTLVYAIDSTNSQLQFLPANYDRTIRITFYYFAANGAIQRYPASGAPPTVTLHAGKTIISLLTLATPPANVDVLQPPLAANSTIIPGSEQLNRAYVYDNVTPVGQLSSGHYYVTLPPAGKETQKMLLGAISFSRADAGRTVKMDYIAADWNILHEDVTVDSAGYLNLSLPDVKLFNKPNYPREPITWGLYQPLDVNTNASATVISLIDLKTGMAHEVNLPRNAAPNQAMLPIYSASSGVAWGILDASDNGRGHLRVGSGTPQNADWTTLVGQTYRVFFRVRRDWTLQMYRAPAQFGYLDVTGEDPSKTKKLCWDLYAHTDWSKAYVPPALPATQLDRTNRQSLFVPPFFAGQSIAVDYQYRRVYSYVQAPTAGDPATLLRLDTIEGLAAGMQVSLVSPLTPTILQTVTITAVDGTAKTITLSSAPSAPVDLNTVITSAQIFQSTGEVHTIPPNNAANNEWNSRVVLRNFPLGSSVVTVRGVSITIRALWAQPHNGLAAVYKNLSVFERPLNQRWQSRAMTIMLVPTKP